MNKSRRSGLVLLLIGVLINNYAYLHDIVWQRHEGYIYLGWKSVLAIVVGLAAIAIGAWLACRKAPAAP